MRPALLQASAAPATSSAPRRYCARLTAALGRVGSFTTSLNPVPPRHCWRETRRFAGRAKAAWIYPGDSSPEFRVIARSEATKQSTEPHTVCMDCYAALAMTAYMMPGAYSDPNIVRRRALAADLAGVEHASWLDEQHLHLARGEGLMLDAFRDDIHLAGLEQHGAIAEIDTQLALEDDEGLVGLCMLVP